MPKSLETFLTKRKSLNDREKKLKESFHSQDLREKQESEKIMEQVTSLLIMHEDLLFKLGLSDINSIHHA